VDSRMKVSWNWPSPRRLLYGAVALLIAALAINGIFGPHGWVATYHLKLQVRQEQRAIQQLKQENEQLSNEVRQLKSDPSAIERIARERMGLVKPGELVFKAPGKPASSASVPNSSAAQTGAAPPAPSSAATHR
jgi:cell division protein FtsB